MIIINIYNFLNYIIQITIASIVAFLVYKFLRKRSRINDDFIVLGDKLYNYSKEVHNENTDREDLVKKLTSKLNQNYNIASNNFPGIINKKIDEADEFSKQKKLKMDYDSEVAFVKFSSRIFEINHMKQFVLPGIVQKIKDRWENEFLHYYMNILLTIFLIWFGLMVLLNDPSKNSVFYVSLKYIQNLIIFIILSILIYVNIISTYFYISGSSKKYLFYITLANIYGLLGIMFTPFISKIWSGSILIFSIYYLVGIALTLPIIIFVYRIKSIRSYLNVSFISGYVALAIIELEILMRIIIFIKTYS